MRLLAAGLAGVLICSGQGSRVQPTTDRARVAALGKTILRDSAELPIDVAVNTVVTDAKGRTTKATHATVHLLFHGFNQASGTFRLNSTSSIFSIGPMRDSLAGEYAVFDAFSRLEPKEDGKVVLQIKPRAGKEGLAVTSGDPTCTGFSMQARVPFPHEWCPVIQYELGVDSAGDLTLEHFQMDVSNLPAKSGVYYLGNAEIRSVRAEGSVAKAFVPGDAKPYFLPERVTTAVTTDKGTVTVTNVYTLALNRLTTR